MEQGSNALIAMQIEGLFCLPLVLCKTLEVGRDDALDCNVDKHQTCHRVDVKMVDAGDTQVSPAVWRRKSEISTSTESSRATRRV